MKPNFLLTAAAIFALAVSAQGQAAPTALTVHEWGTFTSLQDETGRAVGGINTDDEPVPFFVHDVARSLLIPATEMPPIFSKGVVSCHPDVTMRLETPVLYFHAPADFHGPVDVRVGFHGGWLTQFYPQAVATTPGIRSSGWLYGHLTAQTLGTLDWLGLRIGAGGDVLSTNERVWLSPRAVQASAVETPDGEREKYLFYRGVGHLDAPLRVVRAGNGGTLQVLPGDAPPSVLAAVDKLWLVDIRPDGTAAYRALQPAPPGGVAGQPLASTPASFADQEYTVANVGRLRAELRVGLVAGGLFEDEADALLNTWEVSYFKSAGLRLFFLTPQSWTDAVLPLTVSGVPAVTRVMIGRIELVTPRQRELLACIAAAPDVGRSLVASFNVLNASANRDPNLWEAVVRGRKTLAQAGVTVPDAYRDYLDLGRFRNALILDAAQRPGGEGLTNFISDCNLRGYPVPSDGESAP